MSNFLVSFLIFAGAFWLVAQFLADVHIQRFTGAILGAALFGAVNALIWWFVMGEVVLVPLGIAFLVLFLTRWLVNALLFLLLDTSTEILVLKNWGTAVLAGLAITGVGAVAEEFLVRSY